MFADQNEYRKRQDIIDKMKWGYQAIYVRLNNWWWLYYTKEGTIPQNDLFDATVGIRIKRIKPQ